MNGWTWALIAVCGVLLVWVTVSCAGRIRRLDRLHMRVDAARAGLGSALERRATAALAVAAALRGPPAGPGPGTQPSGTHGSATPDPGGQVAESLRAAVAATWSADPDREAREGAENALGRRLAAVDRSMLPPAVRAELVDAEQLLSLARRVHNDAVRDTLVLRSRRLVRWLHLSGTAPMPAYFEIADAHLDVTTPASAAAPEAPVAPPR